MPPALKALLAQLAGCLLALGAARSSLLPAGLWPLVAVQAVGAAGAAIALRSAPWWRWIHLGFIPLVVGALHLGIAPCCYLAAFVSFALVYWISFLIQVPLFLYSNKINYVFGGLRLPMVAAAAFRGSLCSVLRTSAFGTAL